MKKLFQILFLAASSIFILAQTGCSSNGGQPLAIGGDSTNTGNPIPTGNNGGTGGSGFGTCSATFNGTAAQGNFGLNSNVSAAVNFSGLGTPASACLQILHYDSSSSSYIVDTNKCGSYPDNSSITLSSAGQFRAVVTVSDSSGTQLCTNSSAPQTYTVGSSSGGTTPTPTPTPGGGGAGSVSIGGVGQNILTIDLNQYFEVYSTASGAPDGIDLVCDGQDYGGTISYSAANTSLGANVYQTNFFVYDSFPADLVGKQNACQVTAKVGATASGPSSFTLLPQIKEIVYSDGQPQSSTGDRAHISAWGSFGNAYIMSYNCDNGPGRSYTDAQDWVLAKTNLSVEMELDASAIGKLCHIWIGETGNTSGWAPNPRSFDFTP